MNIHKLFSHRVHQLPCCQARVPFLDRQFMEVQHLDDDSCAFIMLDPNATKEKWKKQTVRFCGKTVRFVWVLGGSRYCSFPRLRFLASSCQIDACDQLVFELIDQSTSRWLMLHNVKRICALVDIVTLWVTPKSKSTSSRAEWGKHSEYPPRFSDTDF